MILGGFPVGLCIVSFSNPENNTEGVHFSGTVNVSFECVVFDPTSGEQRATQWFIHDFRGTPQSQSVSLILPDTILEGNSTNGTSIFLTFRTSLIFPEYLEDFHLATLACGFSADADEGLIQFPLRVYGKHFIHSSVLASPAMKTCP